MDKWARPSWITPGCRRLLVAHKSPYMEQWKVMSRHRAHYDVTVMSIGQSDVDPVQCRSGFDPIESQFPTGRDCQIVSPRSMIKYVDTTHQRLCFITPHDSMKTLSPPRSAPLSLCRGIHLSPVDGGFPSQRASEAEFWCFLCCQAEQIVNSSPQNKMADISQTIFSEAFSSMKSFVFWLIIHWSLFLRVQSSTTQHLV